MKIGLIEIESINITKNSNSHRNISIYIRDWECIRKDDMHKYTHVYIPKHHTHTWTGTQIWEKLSEWNVQ